MSTEFTLHDLDSAPEGSKPLLEKFTANFGRIIGFYGMLAESPEALSRYKALADAFVTAYEAAGGTVTVYAAHEDDKADYSADLAA